MIEDGRKIPNDTTITADVCIVGAGVAGISVALELIGAPFKVCLLESGGLEPEAETQSLCGGEVVGFPYYPLETARSRGFGGSSYRWLLELGDNTIGARLRPLDAIDFEERNWIPHSGWPFDKSHLEPFYARAQVICGAGPYSYSADSWSDPELTPQLALLNGRVNHTVFQFVRRERFTRDHRLTLKNAENVTALIHATAVDIEATESIRSVKRICCAILQHGGFWVKARIFVLALGGIETPRLLLLSNKQQQAGLGNAHDLVGRYFMEHPHLWSGYYVPLDPSVFDRSGFYKIHAANGTLVMGKLILSERTMRQERLLNYCVSLNAAGRPSVKATMAKGASKLRLLASAVRHGDVNDFNRHLSTVFPVINEFSISAYRKFMRVFRRFAAQKKFEVFRLNHMAEQAPNPDSRVTLSHERDALGQPRVQLNWQLTAQDIRSMIRAQHIIDQELRTAGLGRLNIEMTDDTPPPDLHGGWHHMGTTRMHRNPKLGVVDENCRVHGLSNLYVAGPSVFPTGGCANPALTLVALAVRLADHLRHSTSREQTRVVELERTEVFV